MTPDLRALAGEAIEEAALNESGDTPWSDAIGIPLDAEERFMAAASPDAIIALLDALDAARAEAAALRTARFVATYWRDAGMKAHREGAPYAAFMTHPLACVLGALDGETEPVELGISEDRWDDFRAALAATGGQEP